MASAPSAPAPSAIKRRGQPQANMTLGANPAIDPAFGLVVEAREDNGGFRYRESGRGTITRMPENFEGAVPAGGQVENPKRIALPCGGPFAPRRRPRDRTLKRPARNAGKRRRRLNRGAVPGDRSRTAYCLAMAIRIASSGETR